MSLASWQREIVERGELYRVGGAVRDRILGIADETDDDFLVRGVPPDALEEILSRYGNLALVGKSFGVYKFTPSGRTHPYDIVYPRREVSTGVHHRAFDVQWDWTLPVEEDLRRRDFTLNAIAERLPGGDLVDPFDGRGDISRRTLRMIFPEAFEEDPLRVVRGARFAGRFDLEIDSDTWSRMVAAGVLTRTLSPERVQEELSKILQQSRRPSLAIDILRRTGVLAIWLPEVERCYGVEQNEYHPDSVYWHSLKSCDAAPADNLRVRWAALLHDTGKVDARQVVHTEVGDRVVFYGHETISARMTDTVLERLRYPKSFVATCRHLVAEHMFHYVSDWKPATVRRFIGRIGLDCLDDLLALREADCRSRDLAAELEKLDEFRRRVAEEIRDHATLRVSDLAIDGRDLMELLGIGPGRAVGMMLEHLLDRVMENPALNERETLLKLALAEWKAWISAGGEG